VSQAHAVAPELAAAGPTASPGARLRAERERRGLGIEQVTEALHVETRLVQAMEVDQFAAFDAPVYARGFLRKYAGWLELPDAELLGAYEQLHAGPAAPSLIPVTAVMPRLHDLRALPIALAAAAVLLVSGSLWWWLARPRAPAPARPSPAAVLPAALPASPATAPTAAAGALTLRASRECWAEVFGPGGARRLYELVHPGESRRVPGPGPWHVFLGAADGVALSVGDRTVAVPAARRAGATARFVVAADGVAK